MNPFKAPGATAAPSASLPKPRNLLSFAWQALQLPGKRNPKAVAAAPHTKPPARAVTPPMTTEERDVAEMTGHGPVAAARRRERARCEAIMTSDAGLRFPKQAATLAFETRMTRTDALHTLSLVAASQTGPAAEGPRPLRHLGARSGATTSSETLAASWDRAMQRGAGRPSN